MLRVGLTGGIGSGKSMVAAQLAQHGAWIIDSDRLAREVVEPGTEGLRAVVEEFGQSILTQGGALDRPALAARVFEDAQARKRLNAIVHPLVGRRSAELFHAAPPDAIVVHDIPLLVETGQETGFPLVIVVHTEEDIRVRRLADQRGMPEADARARIGAQATDEQRRAAADVWLDNGGSRDDTVAAVARLWTERLVPFESNLRHRCPAPRPTSPVLVAPDDTWVLQARRLIARIRAVVGQRAVRVDHIGSTAVPGLDAKDVLDVQLVVADMNAAHLLAAELSGMGLVVRDGHWCDQLRDGSPRDKALAVNADPGRAVNCHVRPVASPSWRDALLLRDWLRAHPAAVREYADVKHELAGRQWETVDAYATAKTPFVNAALDRAQRWAATAGWRPF